MLDPTELKKAIDNKDAKKIAFLMKENNLKIEQGKLVADKSVCSEFIQFWDKRQLVKKINLNSL
jgi:uncharacterized protein YajQ (UPF0234 family)